MTTQNGASLQKVYWEDVREEVLKANPEFVVLVDELSPGKEFPLYKARYPYGSPMIEEGVFYLPTAAGEIVPLASEQLADEIKQDFSYTTDRIPLGMMLQNSCEVFIQLADRSLPQGLYGVGDIFALWIYLDSGKSYHPTQVFSASAGARSICMLPNIGDVNLHSNLKRDFNVRTSAPKHLFEQWEVFKEIVKNSATGQGWHAETLLFTTSWMEKLFTDVSWRTLLLFLQRLVWKKSAFWRNKIYYDFAFSRVQAARNLKPNPYLLDTAKHLFAIGSGAATGFGVATDDSMAPVKLLQQVYVESYGLKKYVPTIVLPMPFSLADGAQPVYYSLQFPTTMEFSPKSRKLSSTLSDLSELKYLTNIFIEEVQRGRLGLGQTILEKVVEQVDFEFYHNKPDQRGEVLLTKHMVEHDPLLKRCDPAYGERSVTDFGTFVRGCVQIFRK